MQTVRELVLTSLREAQATRAELSDVNYDDNTPLIGRGTVIDSLGLVQLIVDVEQRVQDDLGLTITVADDRAMSQRNSPFRTVGALSDYVQVLVEEQRTNGAA
jgi:acyl carrier protein